MKLKKIFILFIVLLFYAGLENALGLKESNPQSQEVTVSGKIIDYETRKGIVQATIRWGNYQSNSREDGNYDIRIPQGIRQINVSHPEYPSVYKVVKVKKPESSVHLDILLSEQQLPRLQWVISKGPEFSKKEAHFPTDYDYYNTLWITDRLFNNDIPIDTHQLQGLEHCPRWSPVNDEIAFSLQSIPSSKSFRQTQGIQIYDLDTKKCRRLGPKIGFLYLDWSPDGKALVCGTQSNIYLVEGLNLRFVLNRRIYSRKHLEGVPSTLRWSPWNTILFTWQGDVAGKKVKSSSTTVNNLKIFSLNPEEKYPKPKVFSKPGFSVSSPLPIDTRGWVAYGLISNDGSSSKILVRNFLREEQEIELLTGDSSPSGIFPLLWDQEAKELFFLKGRELHLYFLDDEIDLVLSNMVFSAHYRKQKD